ncbi:MAG: hypothetical protein SGJ04_07605 [Bacteroidota bacterium]|nr:hypothetical protein [Bacteroidota bacterium]
MKKVFALVAIAASVALISCNEKKTEGTEAIENTKDSANDVVDSSADQMKMQNDSVAEKAKNAADSAANVGDKANDKMEENAKDAAKGAEKM